MKGLKKVLGAILTAALVGTMTLSTAFAAPSPQTNGTVTGTTTVTDANGNAVSVTLQTPDATVVADAQKTSTIQTVLGSDYQSGMQVADVKDVVVPAGTVFPLTITFSVKGVDANCTGAFMHWTGSAWEKVAATFGNGTMTGTFNSLSPVAFVVKYSSTSSASGTSTSPKTGEASMVLPVALAAVATVTLVAVRKKKEA